MKKIGFATSIPIEIIIASGNIPVDLNNSFINYYAPRELIHEAELEGFPRNFCSWIKGIFAVARKMGLKDIITVSEGECSNSEKLAEVLRYYGIMSIPFSYPHSMDEGELKHQIESLMYYFDVSWEDVNNTSEELSLIRNKLNKIDELSYKKNIISGFENYYWQISSSDFNSNYKTFNDKLDIFLKEIETRDENIYGSLIRIGLIGIPPIIGNLFETVEKLGGNVIFNEMPRQFSMVNHRNGLIKQYIGFTYPYSIENRLNDIKEEINKRKIDGIIHYIQSFCPRQVDDMIFRKELKIPYITIESDKPGMIDERNLMRLEAFFERWN